MIVITQRLVLVCNLLVYNQISRQNLVIFNVWAENWHFLFILWPKMAEIGKFWDTQFSTKTESTFGVFIQISPNFACGITRGPFKKCLSWNLMILIFRPQKWPKRPHFGKNGRKTAKFGLSRHFWGRKIKIIKFHDKHFLKGPLGMLHAKFGPIWMKTPKLYSIFSYFQAKKTAISII